ncbi:hypothetical protein [Erwinia sp. S38]|uniref:hypothetical protein n=1 Tax=Erwinia sp. S38 TaxID=2769338 RepID=UPI00351C8E7A
MARKKENCMFCGESATLLCDGIIGWDADEDVNGLMQNCRGMFTCDSPMCRDCATWHGNIFFRGKAGGMETRDHCPICEAIYQAGGHIRVAEHRKKSAIPEPCLTKEQANLIRQAHWAGYQNPHKNGLKLEQGGGQQCLPF